MAGGLELDTDLVLAIEQGGQSIRVAVYSRKGECVLTHTLPCQAEQLPDGRLEQSSEEVLGVLRDGLAHVVHELGGQCRRLVAAGFAGDPGSVMAWNTETGDALSQVINWDDTRGAQWLEKVTTPAAEVKATTGLSLSPYYGAPKMRWCLEQIPGVKRAAEHERLMIGPLVSYLFSELLETEQNATDPGHAQQTLLWSIKTGGWDSHLLGAFGLRPDYLPSCFYHDSCYGHLPLGGARVPMLSVQVNRAASLFARGRPRGGVYYLNIGSCAYLQCLTSESEAPEGISRIPLWLSETSEQAPMYTWAGVVNGVGAAFPWLAEQTGLTLSRAQVSNALSKPLDPQRPIYLLNAEGGMRGFRGQNIPSRFGGSLSAQEKIAAWAESVVFQLKNHYALMTEKLGAPEKIVVSGELGNIDELNQRLANLTGTVVHATEDVDATLRGIAYTAAGWPEAWPQGVSGPIFHPSTDDSLVQRFSRWTTLGLKHSGSSDGL